MNNFNKLRVYLPVLTITITTLAFTGCQDTPSSSEYSDSGTSNSVMQKGSYSNVAINTIPDGLTPNSKQYKNSSKPVATGKSGGVTLTARAMMNSQMVVDLEVTSGELDSDEEASGTIAKVRVRALDATNPDSDDPVWEVNYNKLNNGGSFTESYDNLLHGQQLDIHANVRELFEGKKNSARTGVVSLLETVKFRPDLAVTDIEVSTTAFILDPVFIVAEISENLTDLGATADCVLSIDGTEIDRAAGIWVDAGDAVLCSFQTQFETAGTKNGVVSVENVTPGDFDYGNNSSTFQIQVTEPNLNDFHWNGSAFIDTEDYTYTYNDWYYGWYYGGDSRTETGKRQELWVNSSTTKPVGFPVDISVNVTSGSHTWMNESLTSVNPTHSDYYYNQSIIYLPNNSSITVFSYNENYYYTNNYTYVYLQRYARDMVYYGYNYWNGYYYYEYNDTLLPYGNDVAFKVTLNGSEGSATLMGEIPLSAQTYNYNYCYYYGCSSQSANYLYGYSYGSPD